MSIDLLDWTRQSQVQNRPGASVAAAIVTAVVGGPTTAVLIAAVAGRTIILYSVQMFIVPGGTVAVGDGDRSSPVVATLTDVPAVNVLGYLVAGGPKPVDILSVVSGFGPGVGLGFGFSLRAGYANADAAIVAVYQVV